MQTDNKTLLSNVETTFKLALDASLPLEERIQYDALGHKLRTRLVSLLSAKFVEGTPAVSVANKKMKEVNAVLKKRLEKLESAAKTIGALADLISIIDDLFKLPFLFV
ncbi:hypothetical protein BH10ACI1_BH10ACI1_33990 [soil metagenome]